MARDKGAFPARPALTPAFLCGMAFWAACAAAYSSGSGREAGASTAAAVAAAAVFAVSLAVALNSRARMGALVAASLAVGALLGCAQAASIHEAAASLAGTQEQRVELEVLEDSMDHGFGENALVRGALGESGPLVFEARLGQCGPLLAGERVVADARFRDADVAGDRYAWQDGACGALSAEVVERRPASFPIGELIGLRSAVIDRIGAQDERHALLQALVCGYRRNVRGTELYAAFQTCGLAHLVAVSGAHLVIVTGLFASVLKRLRAPRKATVAVLVAAMGSYYVIAGMPVSALRAAIMSALGLLAYFGRRRPSSLNAIGIGLFAIVAADPPASISASLVLSALSTAGIVVFGPLVQAWFDRTPLGGMSFVSDALALTLAASSLSQLYACSLFGVLPLIAPLANVVTAPLFPLVCGSGLFSGMAEAALGGSVAPVGEVSAALSGLLVGAVSLVSKVPFASVPFSISSEAALAGSALFAALLWTAWPRPSARSLVALAAVASAVLLGFAVTGDGSDRIVMLDVGQGDAVLVQSRGQTLLVDTGNQDAKLLRGLAESRVAHLDSVLITHADDDHCGSLDQLERSVDVGRVIVADEMLTCGGDSARSLVAQAGRTARDTLGVDVGDSFKVGAFTARVVWPRSFTEEGGNADSLCVLLEYDGDDDGTVDFTAFMTGDAEKDEVAEMIAAGSVGDVDVLKVGHHGSRNGSTPEEMRVLDPEIALISCGANNRYGHPTRETLDQLAQVGADVFRTDQDGAITCAFTPQRITVRCENR